MRSVVSPLEAVLLTLEDWEREYEFWQTVRSVGWLKRLSQRPYRWRMAGWAEDLNALYSALVEAGSLVDDEADLQMLHRALMHAHGKALEALHY